MEININGKKITRKAAAELIGKERLEARIQEAREAHQADPWELISWMDGMEISFD